MRWVGLLVLLWACGDDRPGADALVADDTPPGGDLFGEPCTLPPFPEIGICREGEGACHDEPGGPVCRPFCDFEGEPQCEARNGVEVTDDRGACVCVPP